MIAGNAKEYEMHNLLQITRKSITFVDTAKDSESWDAFLFSTKGAMNLWELIVKYNLFYARRTTLLHYQYFVVKLNFKH